MMTIDLLPKWLHRIFIYAFIYKIGDVNLLNEDIMVRRIQSCHTCQARFVAVANALHCQSCRRHDNDEDKPACWSSSVQGGDADTNHSDTEDSSSLGNSEGGDDVHCTQLLPDDDENDDSEERFKLPPGQRAELEANCTTFETPGSGLHTSMSTTARMITPLDHKPLPVPPSNPYAATTSSQTMMKSTGKQTTSATSTEDICFMCGTRLSNLKRRIDHIKRCSKKHAISGRDVKANTEMEAFVEASSSSTSTMVVDPTTAGVPKSSINPYTRESTWHGDANLTLRLAAAASTTTTTASSTPAATTETTTTTKQTSLTSFLNHPARNINNVLMAGARRMTKTAEVLAASFKQKQNKNHQEDPQGRKRGRGGNFPQKSNYANRECPVYKKIPGTDFVCDGFHFAKSSLTQNYFLTHFHSDHYGGITSSWNMGIIYCSLPTATLVTELLGVDKKYLHPLPMNTPTVIASRGKPITVTLLDANHCPGAVMFLFQVGKRNILHVGDFRWNRDYMLMQQPGSPLKGFASGQDILDDLFLDTTYCNPRYSLPSQAETIEAIQILFQKELDRCKGSKTCKTLHLFGAYTIGKEKMYLSMAERFHLKVYVDARRYRILSALNWPKERMALLTTHKEEASIWVVPLGDCNMKTLPDYLVQANSKPFAVPYDRIVGYRPTGWSMGSKPSSSLVSSRYNGNLVIHSVPYSEHSSFPELVDCLACLKPQRIVPTVNASKSDEQVKTMLKALREKQTTLPFVPLTKK